MSIDLGISTSTWEHLSNRAIAAAGIVYFLALVAHLVEEAEQPVGMPLWLEVERRSSEG